MLDCDRQQPQAFQECVLRRRIHSPPAFGCGQDTYDLDGPQRRCARVTAVSLLRAVFHLSQGYDSEVLFD